MFKNDSSSLREYLQRINNRGQVAVDYVLMMIVVITLVMVVFRVLSTRMSFDVNDCAGGNSFNPICAVSSSVNFLPGQAVGPNSFRSYRINR